MADDHIKLTMSAMESCSKSFLDCSNKIVDIAQALAAASAEMKSAWDDPAQKLFEDSMEEIIYEFDKAYDCLRALSSFSSYVIELYQTTDQSVKKLL